MAGATAELRRAAAYEQYGVGADRLLAAYHEGDPPADALVDFFATLPAGRGRRLLDDALAAPSERRHAPASLQQFLESLEPTPWWVDWDQIERGGRVIIRSGALAAMAMGLFTLPATYRSPIGTKPLIFAGGLVTRAPRRLRETSRYVFEACEPGGLRTTGTGFTSTVRVRLMHAQVRRLLLRSGRWDDGWGVPICQTHIAATSAALTVGLLHGARRLGCRFSPDEADAVVALWRYAGWLAGSQPDLLCATENEAWRVLRIVEAAEGEPDDDCRLLVRALMEARPVPQIRGEWVTRFNYGVSFALLGSDGAAGLDYPRTLWRWLVPLMRWNVRLIEVMRRVVPFGGRLATSSGRRAWSRIARAGAPATVRSS